MFFIRFSILFFVQIYFLNKSKHIMYISHESYDLFTIVTTKSSKQVLFHIYYMSQNSKVISSTIPIVFLKQIIVLLILIIFLIQVIVFSMYFYLVLNLTMKDGIFTYDWASPTGNPSRKDRRTGFYAFFDVNKLLVVLGIQNDRYGLSNNFFLLLLQSKSQLVYGFFVGASWARLAVGMVAGAVPFGRG